MTTMPREPTGDPVLEAEIERAMRPYRSLLPKEMQDVFEDILVMAYTEHPRGQAILARLRPQQEGGSSGPRAILKGASGGDELGAKGVSQKRGPRGTRGRK